MRILVSVAFLFISMLMTAQNKLWKGYFSYNDIRAITASNTNTYAATDNAVFVLNDAGGETRIYNTVNDFKLDDINAIAYSADYKKIIVGAKNGKIAIIDEATENIYFLNDIYNKSSLTTGEKVINAIFIHAGYAYLATGYGITAVRLQDNHFGDSYYIGNEGNNENVKEVVVAGQYLYANIVNVGIKRALLNTNLIDYTNWEMFSFENWLSIAAFNDQLIGVKDDLSLNRFDGADAVVVDTLNQEFIHFTIFGDRLTVVTYGAAYSYNVDFNRVTEVLSSAVTGELSTALAKNDTFFIGSSKNGLFKAATNTPNQLTSISPKGALSNNFFRVAVRNNVLWSVYGGYNNNFNPYTSQGLGLYGINRLNLNNIQWDHLSYEKIAPLRATSHIGFNPKEPNTVYIGSFFDGMLKIDIKPNLEESVLTHYNHQNTGPNGLEALFADGDIRVNGPVFDNQGNGWVTNSQVNRHIKKFDSNNNWQSYDIKSILNSSAQNSLTAPEIDKNDTKWMGSYSAGVVAFNDKTNQKAKVDNLPHHTANAVAIDQKNQVWIGTNMGLRVVPSVDLAQNNVLIRSNAIIIMDEGKAQELFYQQPILKIKVDGSNNKWVSIADAGIFLISEDGQNTIYRFDTSNSPLPDNNVTDIAINENTGEVFFATRKGMVSFQHFATAPASSLDNVYVYPNPVRPEYTGEVNISGLTSKAVIKITDVSGNLVYETTSSGGTVQWSTANFSGQKVKSGVYMVFVTSADGAEKTVKKLMIIR